MIISSFKASPFDQKLVVLSYLLIRGQRGHSRADLEPLKLASSSIKLILVVLNLIVQLVDFLCLGVHLIFQPGL